MSTSKLGPHAQGDSAAVRLWARHAPIVKALNPAVLQVAQRGAITVYRRWWADSEMNARIANMAVDQTVADIMQGLGGFVPTYVDGPFNEVAQRQGLGLEQHADFMEAFVPKMKAALLGVKVAGFAFSVGNPGSSAYGDRDDFQYLYNRGWCGIDALSLHHYFGKTTAWDVSRALRYRPLFSTVPSHPPALITEGGMDAVPGGAPGYRASGLSDGQYLDLCAAWDAELQKDDDIIGAVLFTGAPTDPRWANYSTDPLDTSRFWTIGALPMGTSPAPSPTSPAPSFNASALAGEFQTMTGGGDATKGLTFDFCASVIEGVVADPNFTGVNDDDVRRVLGLENAMLADRVAALEQRDALLTQALHRILTGEYTGASGAAADVVALQGGTDDLTGEVKTPAFQ